MFHSYAATCSRIPSPDCMPSQCAASHVAELAAETSYTQYQPNSGNRATRSGAARVQSSLKYMKSCCKYANSEYVLQEPSPVRTALVLKLDASPETEQEMLNFLCNPPKLHSFAKNL
eukprot:scaffold245537_cov15-Tisochrysis_lutea.AAC.1